MQSGDCYITVKCHLGDVHMCFSVTVSQNEEANHSARKFYGELHMHMLALLYLPPYVLEQ
mgnify:CR=1